MQSDWYRWRFHLVLRRAPLQRALALARCPEMEATPQPSRARPRRPFPCKWAAEARGPAPACVFVEVAPSESRGNICSPNDGARFPICPFQACPRCGRPVPDPRRGRGPAADWLGGRALAICLLLCGSEPESYESAVVRWLGRYCLERPTATLEEVRGALAAFERLPQDPEAATRELEGLARA
jgi:hypothetical protein